MSKFSLPYRSVSKKLLTKVPQFISPNLLVYSGFLLFLIFPVLLVFDFKIISIVLLVLVVFLDHLDGDLARNRNETSSYGAIIDTISDRLRGLILVLSLGFILLDDYSFMRFVPLILFLINEFVIPFLRIKNENYTFRTNLIYNIDLLGWVPFSYIYPFIVLLPIAYLYQFYVLASIYVAIKMLVTLYLRHAKKGF